MVTHLRRQLGLEDYGAALGQAIEDAQSEIGPQRPEARKP